MDSAFHRPTSTHLAAIGTAVSTTKDPTPNVDAAKVDLERVAHRLIDPFEAGVEERQTPSRLQTA